MALDKIMPDVEKTFGNLWFHKQVPENNVYEVNKQSRRELSERCYEISSSAQEGAILVFVPARSNIIADSNYNQPMKLVGASITVNAKVKNQNVIGVQATSEPVIILHARALLVEPKETEEK